MTHRAYPRDRETLLRELDAGRERLERTFGEMDDGRLDALRMPNGWRARDVLAHIGAWEELDTRNLEALRAGGEPPSPIEGPWDVDAVNARFDAQHRERTAADTRRYEADAYARFRHALEEASDAELFDATHFAWTDGRPYAVHAVEDSYAHWEDHLRDVEGALAAIEQPTRDDLVRRLEEGRTRLGTFLAGDDDAALSAPHFANGWSKRDLLVHLAAWEERIARVFAAYRSGQEPDGRDRLDEDAFNARVAEEAHGLSGTEAMAREQAAYDHLRAVVDHAPDEDLFHGARFADRTDGQPFVWWIVGNTFGHLDEHLASPRL